jgi:hypothetical protein
MSVNSSGHGEKFSRRKELALAALLEHPTLPEAAAACKVHERTLRRWLGTDEFAKQYRVECGRLLEVTINVLRKKSLSAVKTLVAMSDGDIAASAPRLSAARAVIELALRGEEILELEERLFSLEEIARDRR